MVLYLKSVEFRGGDEIPNKDGCFHRGGEDAVGKRMKINGLDSEILLR
jgi:hypothetical protein